MQMSQSSAASSWSTSFGSTSRFWFRFRFQAKSTVAFLHSLTFQNALTEDPAAEEGASVCRLYDVGHRKDNEDDHEEDEEEDDELDDDDDDDDDSDDDDNDDENGISE